MHAQVNSNQQWNAVHFFQISDFIKTQGSCFAKNLKTFKTMQTSAN